MSSAPPEDPYADDGESGDASEADQDLSSSSQWSTPGYERSIIESVWQFAETVAGNDPALWRKDEFGAWINRLDYGRRHSQFGWEICDIGSTASSSTLSALRPMQWQNYLDQVAAMTQTRITADGKHNVRRLL